MATMLVRRAVGTGERLKIDGFKMYPDSTAIIRLRLPRGKRSVVNIYLSEVEVAELAARLTGNENK